jgi:UDP-N-acetylglucosamine 1-carboxyvinyltransferase
MNAFEIVGGKPLKGEIIPQGAKNEALQIISAVLLTEEKITISNIPDIKDVNKLIELVADLGVKVERINQDTYTFEASKINLDFFQSDAFRAKGGSLRGSIMIVGPLLARFGKAAIPKPGGDKIGRRRLDTHFLGFEKLGAKFNYDKKTNFFNVDASNLKGAYILLDEASVTGTANVVMAAVLAKGETTIYNAACEPYLQQLCKMLNRMGAKITGIGSNLLKIEGVKKLGGTEHRLLPDMIEIGSFIGLAAMTESEITIKDVHFEELGMIPEVFRKLGIKFELRGDDIFIPSQKHYEVDTFIDGSIMTIADAPWPGFTPDLLSIMLVIATQAKGNVLIHQKMFESRLFFVDKLIDMGAQIILCDPHRATVIGLDKKVKLRGIEMTSPDIRAGVSLLIAALSAQGTSIIYNIEQIERGYQNIDTRLKALGADIKRINVTNKSGH